MTEPLYVTRRNVKGGFIQLLEDIMRGLGLTSAFSTDLYGRITLERPVEYCNIICRINAFITK